MLQHALQAFLIAAVLSPFSYYAGLAAKRLRLPQITGYLISGIVCGPFVLGILSTVFVSDLNIIEGACLGVIGLAAGAELQLSELNKSKKQVVWITVSICAFTWVLCYGAFVGIGSIIPFLGHITHDQLLAISSLGATLMMARSPASAIAVLKEVEGKGPFCSLVMGVVVLKDVLVIVAFAVNMQLVPMILSHSAAGLSLAQVLRPILSVLVSLAAGTAGGMLLEMALKLNLHTRVLALLPNLGPSAAHRAKMVLVLCLSTLVFAVSRWLEAEPLLACVTMGMLVVNHRSEHGEQHAEELPHLINQIMSLTNVAFFGLAGASLKLTAIAESVYVAVVVVLVRLLAIAAGSWAGCKLSGTKPEHRRLFWLSMVTQAGVAMGLARIAATHFPVWGAAFQTVMMSIIMVNMLVGPPMFRTALVQVGEARAGALPGHIKPSDRKHDSEDGNGAARALEIRGVGGHVSPVEHRGGGGGADYEFQPTPHGMIAHAGGKEG